MTALTQDTQPSSSLAAIVAPVARARREGSGRTIGRIDVHADAATADIPWAMLEDACPATIYQTRRFLLPWLAAFAPQLGMTPMLVVAHDSAGAPVAFLPFGVRRQGPFTVAEFLGGKDSNANIGLFKPGFDFARDDLVSLLRAAAAKANPKPDLFRLANQPAIWAGEKNPLDIFPHQASASYLHGARLQLDAAAFVKEHQSKDTAKKLRKKRQKLEAVAPVAHAIAKDAETARKYLDVFFEQKIARFRDKNIDSAFDTPEARHFFERAALDGLAAGRPAMEMHALLLGDKVIATYGGGSHREHFHLMINSFDSDAEISRSSPGDLLLQAIIEQKCREGFTGFDLGIGEARYKDSWCDESQALFDSIMPVSTKGRLYAAFEAARLNAKRAIKQSSWAWPMAMKLLGRK
jgi:CelD/BcsL family acetyltransferase involved in cellulose biosynthesis